VTVKILFDSSIIDKNKVAELENSPIKKLINKGSLKIYGNPHLIDESVCGYNQNKEIVSKNLKYYLSIVNGRWLRKIHEIIKLEHFGHNYGKKYWFYTEEEQNYFTSKIKHLYIEMNISETDVQLQSKEYTKFKEDKKIPQKETYKRIREDFPRLAKMNGKNHLRAKTDYPFSLYYIEAVDSACLFELNTYEIEDINILYEKWKTSINDYPFFTAWLKSLLYLSYYSQIGDKSLDINANDDIMHICLMHDIDIFVSADTHFMKAAFENIHPHKKLMTFSEFLKFIKMQ